MVLIFLYAYRVIDIFLSFFYNFSILIMDFYIDRFYYYYWVENVYMNLDLFVFFLFCICIHMYIG